MTEHDREGEQAAQQAQENAARPPGTAKDGADKEGEPAAQQAQQAQQARDEDATS